MRYGAKRAVDDVSFTIPKGRVVGLLGHNGAGKTTLMKAMVGLARPEGELQVLGLDPRRERVAAAAVGLLHPRRGDPAALGAGGRPDHADERPAPAVLGRPGARSCCAAPASACRDKVKTLSKGMVVQAHLALVAAIDARLMILDEPTLGLDVLSRKAFYEMLIDEWCDGERSVVISTHQVEEIESLLSDVLMLNEGKLVLSISLEDIDTRFVALSHDAAVAEQMAAAHPLLRYRTGPGPGGSAALFDGAPPAHVQALGQRMRPSLVDLFVALTRKPELDRTQF